MILVFLISILLLLSSSACTSSSESTPPPPTTTRRLQLTPYWTSTPERADGTSFAEVTATGRPSTPTPPPTPTPTPVLYKVKKGDTLLGIAFHHGVTLEELQAANPDIDPNLLSVDTALVLPPPQTTATPGPPPTPGPEPVEIGEPRCYPQGDGALWCFASARNPGANAVENVTAWLYLYGVGTGPLTGTEISLPLNLLPPGQSLPLPAFFPPGAIPAHEGALFAAAELRSALAVDPAGGRYLETSVQISRQEISLDGLQAFLRGRIILEDNLTPAQQVSLVAVAYGEDRQIVGVRNWSASEGLSAGGALRFDITVYSAGPPIEQVEVLVEARP